MPSRLRGLPPVLALLGGGVFVAVGIGAWRYLRARRAAAAAGGQGAEDAATEAGSGGSGAPATHPLPAEPAPPVAESIVPEARDPEKVVEGLVPVELAHATNLRLDLLIAGAVIVAAIAVVLLVSGNLG
jgi:hypothetical protein